MKQDRNSDFIDSTKGIELWDSCREDQKDFGTGYIKIKIMIPMNSKFDLKSFRHFLSKVFPDSFICTDFEQYRLSWYPYKQKMQYLLWFTVINSEIQSSGDIQKLYDECRVLYTYYLNLFQPLYEVEMHIYLGIRESNDKSMVNFALQNKRHYNKEFAVDETVIEYTDAADHIEGYDKEKGIYTTGGFTLKCDFYPCSVPYEELGEKLKRYIDQDN